ncbi:SOS response-associated peptidase [Lentzea flaviverrucosa]|uniref:Abasic site processing protein n=1 Tax=Lentzea flaviverrucosa TaxID=200379 RepID=A0A1H9U4L1_9PSEU|nr:SOS response-associated peptidase [Lentzea flaviverrucosa]RDI33316.1 putative SOS response-associated peptidase YedK [Lentzea flaviverrucosa]SES04104.1 Putative SOS response-associated peptidase YedK [Lentzea flaviverrucosa]
MCGRYASTKDPALLAAEFDAVDGTGDEAPGADYNIAPTKRVMAVVERRPEDEELERAIRVMRWGLVPHWAKDLSGAAKMINARAESVLTKPAYKQSAIKRRCIIPAAGWYEWQPGEGRKQPYFISLGDDTSLAMAGLWSVWWKDDVPTVTCAVLTTEAIGAVTEVHHRMPLLLPPDRWSAWLDPASLDPSELLAPDPSIVEALELRPVSTEVNSVKNNKPSLLDRVSLTEDEKPSSPLFELS